MTNALGLDVIASVSARSRARRIRDPASSGVAITWLGHATVLVEIDGVRVITDPVLRHRIGPLVRIAPDAPVPGTVDCVLLSHLHADHTDLPTLRALERSGPILAPHPAREWLTRAAGLPTCAISGRATRSGSAGCGSGPRRRSTIRGAGRSGRRRAPAGY